MAVVERSTKKLSTLNKTKLLLSCLLLWMLVLPIGWGISTYFATGLTTPYANNLLVHETPTGFDEAVELMGFSVSKTNQYFGLGMATTTVVAPGGMSEKKAYELLSTRFPNLNITSDSIDMDTASGARLNP